MTFPCHDYRQLKAWQEARGIVLTVYEVTSRFPTTERFGLASQMRRAAMSIVANIAGGAGRGSDSDFARFVRYAVGSSTELECEIYLGVALGFIEPHAGAPLDERLPRGRAMLVKLERKPAPL